MINDIKLAELTNSLRSLSDLYLLKFKSIRHSYHIKNLYLDLLYLTVTHIQVNEELSDEKINFLQSFYSIFFNSEKMELLTDNIRRKPIPFEMGYDIPVTYKTAINIDNILSTNDLSSKYYRFINILFDFLNNSFDDIPLENVLKAKDFSNSLKFLAIDSLIELDGFN